VSLPVYETAGSIINKALASAGLPSVADPYLLAATDTNYSVATQLLEDVGQDLLSEHDWTAFQTEYIWTTVAGQQRYPFPADFFKMYDQSGWVRNTRLPVGGPLSPQEWQFLSARLVGVTWTVLFRPAVGALNIFPSQGATPGTFVVAFEYFSAYWVKSNAVFGAIGAVPWTANTAAFLPAPTSAQWLPNTAYAFGARVYNLGSSYVCSQAGVSAGAGGPVATGTNIVDNTCRWNFQLTACSVASNVYVCTSAGTTSNAAGATGPTNFGSYLDGTAQWKYQWNSGTAGTPNTLTPSSSSDVVCFDPLLMRRALKFAWLKDRGFDSAQAEEDYLETLRKTKSSESFGAVLRLGGKRSQDPLLSTANLPLTGYGQ
jgi:hypothetical protein